VIVQGQDDWHALREASNQITGEGTVMVNMNDVCFSDREIDSLREGRLRVLRRRALTQVAWNPDLFYTFV
jgi:hypothetical protein